MQSLLFELSIILIVATGGALIARWLKQPITPTYIIAGIILGPILHLITDVELISVYAEIGITFLLFIVGLELDLKPLRIVVSTSHECGVNKELVRFIKRKKKECMVLVTANTSAALQLYKRGADYGFCRR